jgi:DNA-binding FadR family transcriptional regulator
MTEEMIPGLRNSSRADVVARHIESRIAEQALPAGHRLGTKDSLRREFNVAVATFNAAVRLLSSRGTIEIRPGIGGGLFVASPTAFVRLGRKMLELSGESVPVADSLVVRDALEPRVIEDATRHATRRDVAALRTIMTEMEVADLDAGTYLRINWKLHRRMVEISPNLVLRHMYLGLLDFVSHRVHGVTAVASLADREGVRVHNEIVDVIESGDLDRVERIVHAHAALTANHREGGE